MPRTFPLRFVHDVKPEPPCSAYDLLKTCINSSYLREWCKPVMGSGRLFRPELEPDKKTSTRIRTRTRRQSSGRRHPTNRPDNDPTNPTDPSQPDWTRQTQKWCIDKCTVPAGERVTRTRKQHDRLSEQCLRPRTVHERVWVLVKVLVIMC